MGIRNIIHGCTGSGYRRLQNQDENTVDISGQKERKVKCEVVPHQPPSPKMLKLRDSWVILQKLVVEMYCEIMSRTKLEGIVCPTIIFSSQWGLPILSHPTVAGKKDDKHSYKS